MAHSPTNFEIDVLASGADAPPTCAESTLAKALAPEDIRAGDFVAPLHVIYELPSFLWYDEALFAAREQPVRIQFMSESDAAPLKVKSVCLPYVLVKHPDGRQFTLDVRRSKLARLAPGFARVTWKALKRQRPKKEPR